jgi:hypothetical protein
MLFVDLATEQPKTKVQLIQENKRMSLPAAWTDATLEALNVARVTAVPAPTVGEFEVAVKDGVEQVDGEWREKWATQDMFTEYTYPRYLDADGNEVASADSEGYDRTETATKTVQDQKDEKRANDNAALAATAREKRDALLKETDHYGLSDMTMSAEMTTYRQALRDVPQQADFPSTINWPTKPE